MKKILLLILCLIYYGTNAQIHIGSHGDSNQVNDMPINDHYGNSYSQQIILASEYSNAEGISGAINQISWKLYSTNTNHNNSNNWTVFLGHTNKTDFQSSTDYVPQNQLTEVFSGVVNLSQNNTLVTIDLPTEFVYNGTDNLVLAVLQNTPGNTPNPQRFWSYLTENSITRGLVSYSNDPIDVNVLTGVSYNRTYNLPQVIFNGSQNPCVAPKNLSALHLGNNFQAIWESENNDFLNYYYELRTSGEMGSGNVGLIDSGTLPNTATSYTKADVSNSTNYFFYIRKNCVQNNFSLVRSISISPQTTILNNGKLRIGDGIINSINELGMMNHSFYKLNANGDWIKLTYRLRPFRTSFAIDGDGTNEWNTNGFYSLNAILSNISYDLSEYNFTGHNQKYGKISITGETTINNKPLEITYTYNLGQNTPFIVITCKVKNIGTTSVSNLRSWLGISDDWIGFTDSPMKTRGNVNNGNFETIPNPSVRSRIIKADSNQEGAFLFTNFPKANALIYRYSWADGILLQNPQTNQITNDSDGCYAMYLRLKDLEAGESDEFKLYYAAGLLSEINNIFDNAYGYIDQIKTNSAVFNTTPLQDVNGYYIVAPSGSPIPTANEIINGQNYQNTTIITSGQSAIAEGQDTEFPITNLTPNTTYDLYYVNQRNHNGTLITSSIVALQFTTLKELSLTKNVTNINCNGESTGSITVSVEGGLAPYTYLWSNNMTTETINNIPAGVYSVTVTDSNGETITNGTTITQPVALASSITKSDVSCFGLSNGIANIVVSGGTSPYTYSWSHSNTLDTTIANNLPAGNYSVTITDSKQCSITIPYTITEPSEVLAPNITNTQTFCNSAIVRDIEKPNQISIKVYTTPTGGKELLEHTKLSSGVYYVSQIFNACESVQRTLVNIIINDIDAPNSNGNGDVYSIADFSGYDADVIYDGTDDSSVNNTFDLSGGYLIASTTLFNNNSPVRYLPENRFIESSTIFGLSYQLQPYNQNNSLRFSDNAAKSLNSLNPITDVKTLYILGASGQGGSNINIKVNFEDGTFQEFTQLNLKDWFYGTTPEIKGLGRVWGSGFETDTDEPRLYKLSLDLNSINYDKSISNIEFKKNWGGVANVMAVSYKSFETKQVCENSTLADLVVSGTSIKWYANETTTTVLPLSTILNENSFYYATQTVNGCESLRKPFYIKFHDVDAPITQDQSFCIAENKTVGDLVVTGTSIKWYSSDVSTTALNSSDVLVSGTYYATQTLNGCESVTRTPINVTVYNTAAPVSQDQSFCIVENKTVGDLVVTGTSIKWYSSDVSTTALNSSDVLVSGTYYATQTLNGCESVTRTAINVVIYNTSAPVSQDQSFCIAENKRVRDLVATGNLIKWYSTTMSSTPLNINDVLISGTYYATQTLDGCESVARTPVIVTIYNTAIPVSNDQTYCSNENKKVSDLFVQGENVKWYANETSTTVLQLNEILLTGSYYATQTLNGCESVARKRVNVTIIPVPEINNNTISICAYTKISDIIIDGISYNQLRWYNSLNSTNILAPNTQIGLSNTYFVETYNSNCVSNRIAINVNVIPQIPVPDVNNVVYICGSGTISSIPVLSINGGTVEWFANASTNVVLPISSNLNSGTYYVSQRVGDCISQRKAVSVFVLSKVAPVYSSVSVCEGTKVEDINWSAPIGASYEWYTSPTSAVLPSDTILNSGIYYVARNHYGCISDKARVVVTVNNIPSAPTGDAVQSIAMPATLNDIIMNEVGITWFLTERDAINNVNGLSPTTALRDGVAYFGVITSPAGCRSLPTRITVNLFLSDNKFDLATLKVYPNPTFDEVNIEYIDVLDYIEIYSLSGQLLNKVDVKEKDFTLSLDKYSSGVYMIKLYSNYQSHFVKIIKK